MATVGEERTLRVWCPDPAGDDGEREAAMPVDGLLSDCCWLPDGSGVCAVGARGVYLFLLTPGREAS